MALLKLSWLGPPGIEYDGRPLRLEMRKTLALLAYLSLSPQPPTRETLAAMFWPEYDQQHALSNLRRNLSSLAKSLPGGLLEADRERIGLGRVAWLQVDIDEFREQLSFANKHSHLPDRVCPECIASLEKAVAIYNGDFFEGFNLKDCPEFDEWQFFQRESLRQELAAALEKLIDHLSSLNQWEKAISHARRWVSLDQLHEPAQCAMVELLIASGQRSAALRQYENYARLLKEALSQEPSPAAQAMYQQICEKDTRGRARGIAREMASSSISKDYREQIAGPVLKTKLYIPGVRAHHVSRARLIDSMQGIRSCTLTLISAPAGFGKTSLLAEWIAGSSLAVSWLSLDNDDNHPGRFLAYLIHSLQSIDESIGAEAWSMLQMPEPPPFQTILTTLINDCSSLDEHFAFILDDYQSIYAQPIHEMVSFFLDHCPTQLHLVIATRVDPPLPVARLRSRGQMLELRMSNLRFSPEEAASFLNQKMGLDLSARDIEALNARTEGWAAGLQMAALSRKGQENPGRFIQDFSGSHRFIMDYLLEEVFERQPEEIKNFLLRTSVLERLNASLCAAVTDEQTTETTSTARAQEILEHLERSNLFVERLDEERCWYRYHHLFAELLFSRLQQHFPDLIPILHTRAADWYESKGMAPQVIQHALAARDYERAACFVEQVAAALWEHGNYQLAFSWFETLPEEFVISRPWLSMYRAWSLAVDGKVELAEKMLEIVEKANNTNPDSVDQRNLAGYVDYVNAVIADSRGDLGAMIQHDLDALAKLDEKNRLMRRGITFQLGRAYHLYGDQETSQRIWEEIIQTGQQSGARFASIISLCMLTWLKVAVGKLKEAEAICQEAASWIEKVNEPPNSRTAGLVWIVFANVYLEKNQLDLAERYVRDAIQCFERMGNLYALTMGYVLLAGALRRKQDYRGARVSLEKADALVQRRKIYADALAWLRAEKINLWLAQKDLASARQYLIENRITGFDQVDFTTEMQYIALARVKIAQGCAEEAAGLLTRMVESAEKEKRPGRQMKILTVLALAYKNLGMMDQAIDTLDEALALAAPEGFSGIFIDSGEAMIELLKYYLQQNSRVWQNPNTIEFIQHLLGAGMV